MARQTAQAITLRAAVLASTVTVFVASIANQLAIEPRKAEAFAASEAGRPTIPGNDGRPWVWNRATLTTAEISPQTSELTGRRRRS